MAGRADTLVPGARRAHRTRPLEESHSGCDDTDTVHNLCPPSFHVLMSSWGQFFDTVEKPSDFHSHTFFSTLLDLFELKLKSNRNEDDRKRDEDGDFPAFADSAGNSGNAKTLEHASLLVFPSFPPLSSFLFPSFLVTFGPS